MTKDADGRYYLNYVPWPSVVQIAGMNDDDYPSYLRDIAKTLRAGIQKFDPRVLSKYLWIYDQYIKAIELFENLGPRNRYRQNNPENYAAVVASPKLTVKARHARQVIACVYRKIKLAGW
jgi:hypothetical protein